MNPQKIVSHLIARKQFQLFFSLLYKFSVAGMNYGTDGTIEHSGELWTIEYIADKLKKKKTTIFDVGANIGDYSLLLAKTVENSKIYAFEPSKKTFLTMKENIIAVKSIIPVNKGLGDKKAKVTLFSNKDDSGFASLFNRRLDHYNIHLDRKETIQIDTIDSFCKKEGIKKIDFLKMDVEGNELSVLKGAHDMLRLKRINFIQFEFGGCNIDSRTFFQDFFYLLVPNYRIYRIVQNGIVEIQKYTELNEIFLSSNFLAIRKSN